MTNSIIYELRMASKLFILTPVGVISYGMLRKSESPLQVLTPKKT
ncbi:hypothetical protein [Dapis sp. BLCC M229]